MVVFCGIFVVVVVVLRPGVRASTGCPLPLFDTGKLNDSLRLLSSFDLPVPHLCGRERRIFRGIVG